MKRFTICGFLLAITLFALGAVPAAAQAMKFGYVNSQKIMAEAPGVSEAEQALEADMSRYRTEIETMGRELEQMREQYEQQQATLSDAAKQQRQQEIQTKFTTYQQRVGELENTAQQRQAELVEPIMKRITDTIEQIRAEGGYSMIFDASAGVLITADPSLDLTDQVLERLRTSAE